MDTDKYRWPHQRRCGPSVFPFLRPVIKLEKPSICNFCRVSLLNKTLLSFPLVVIA